LKIKKLTLKNYRNYENASIVFDDGLTIITGKNAQGKTNLLESIYFLAIAKSLRVSKEKHLIKETAERATINATILKQIGNVDIKIILDSKTKKTIKINDTPVSRVAELLGNLNAVYFSPDEMKLIKESPENRRRFLDVAISQINKHYFYSLLKYEKILSHRNKLLKQGRTLEDIKPSLEIFTTQLINEGAYIITMRKKFVESLLPFVQKTHLYISDGENLDIKYLTTAGETIEEVKENLDKVFAKGLEKDFLQRTTTNGPHRDDIKITLDGKDIKLFGSQGQQRTATLSLKLAECEILKERSGDYPVLLLDDVLSELDENRRKKLLNFSKKMQTILTCTEFEEKDFKGYTLIKIESGKLLI
jgi:DNA replication and repair protein RecF